MKENKITLVGAGLAGSLCSIYLSRLGFDVEIYERRPDMRAAEISAGRSINLALSARGLHALGEVGLREEILKLAIPMRGRMVHALNGSMNFVPYGRLESEHINSVSRGALNAALMTLAEREGATIHFNRKCAAFDIDAGLLELRDELSGKTRRSKVTRVIGADGSASAVRTSLLAKTGSAFSKDDLEHGYKELTIPAGSSGVFQLEKNALHIWPRGQYMLIALPNLDGSFTCTLFLPMFGEPGFSTLRQEQDIISLFEAQFPDAVPLMPALVEDFFSNPTGHLATIRCGLWHFDGKVCLLGDAAHAIVPFFGQGINCGFEDCSVLNACLRRHLPDWESAFAEFGNLRKANADAIADLSLANYHEMRDHVASPRFALRRQVEFALEEKFPKAFIPRYSMISFHRMPYAEALQRGQIQDAILDELCAGLENVADLDWDKASELVRDRLA